MSPLSGLAHQRLLPASLEARLIGCLGRGTGCVILFVLALIWASILTWSATDPGIARATDARAENLLGLPGAIIADLMLDMLGLSVLVLLLAPMFWAFEMVLSERVSGLRAKAIYYPISVLALAAALASLPVSAAWPLAHGYGGILGELVLNFAATACGLVNPDRAHAVAGLLMVLIGLPALTNGIGIEARELVRVVADPLKPHGVSRSWAAALRGHGRRLQDRLMGELSGLSEGRGARSRHDWQPGLVGGATGSFGRSAYEPRFDDEPTQDHHRSDAAAPDLVDEAADDPEFVADPAFDEGTELMSRAIAERFAPARAGKPLAARPLTINPLPVRPAAAASTAHTPAPPFNAKIFGGGARRSESGIKRPPMSLLKRGTASKGGAEFTQTALRGNARLLEDVLGDYGVKGEVRDIRPGPVVTLFEFEPARGTKSQRIVALADDIARSMSARSVRVAVVAGRNAIGIELPNATREQVALRDLLESQPFVSSDATLPLALGKSISGEPVVADLARMPHLLIAGTTGSGKSVGVNAMILSLLFRRSPEECRFLMIDPKMLELSVYNGIPHLLTPVVTEPQRAVAALNWAVTEMEERYKRMAGVAARSIEAFNGRISSAKNRGEALSRTVHVGFDPRTGQALYEREETSLEPMPHIVVVVDEFADLMIAAGKEIEVAVQRLAQKARAAGIHLIMATQRPSVDIITGTIKANFPTRISFKVASKIDSRTILDEQGAEQLLGQGDMLLATGSGHMARVHGPFVSDEEVESVAEFLRGQGEPRYVEGIGVTAGHEGDASDAEARRRRRRRPLRPRRRHRAA